MQCFCLEVFDLLVNLRNSLKIKLQQKIYGTIAQQALEKCNNDTAKTLFLKRTSAFLEQLIQYIEKRFDFINNKYEALNVFKLVDVPAEGISY